MLPSRRLIILLMGAAPIFLAGSLYSIFAAVGVLYILFLGFYVLLDAAFLPRKNKVHIERIAPDRISLGHSTKIRFEIENLTRRHIQVELAEYPPPFIKCEPVSCQMQLSAGQKVSTSYRLTAYQRGRYAFEPVFVRILPRWGLLYRSFKLDLPFNAVVFPNLVDVKKCELLTRRGLNLYEGLAKLRKLGQGSQFESLKLYVQGDEWSRIDWKATAKRDKLVVRNYETERQQSVIAAIDLGRATVGEFRGLSRADYFVNAALMLAYIALKQKDWFSLIAFSDRIESYLPPVHGLKNLDRVARCLYAIQPRLVESDYTKACHFLSLRNRKRSLLCMMTDVIDRDASSVIISYMARFAKYHLPLIITLANPEILSMAKKSIANRDTIYEKAAAIDTLTRIFHKNL